jgi:hypothetical protein
MAQRGITQIIEDDGTVLKGSIAGVDHKTGVMFLNRPMIDMKLTKDQVFFIMLHEMGHLVLGTRDEEAVDEWAHREYLKRGYSLKQSVYALTRILRFNRDEDLRRANAQYRRALAYDNK